MGGKSIGSLAQGWLTTEVAVIKEGVAIWVGVEWEGGNMSEYFSVFALRSELYFLGCGFMRKNLMCLPIQPGANRKDRSSLVLSVKDESSTN